MNEDNNFSTPKAYEKFFDRFKEIDTLDIKEWKPLHLLAYFCRKYVEYYGFQYTFSFKKSPSSSDEITHIKRLGNSLTSNPEILKQYIDWIFEAKVKERKKKITTIAFIAHQDVITQFKFNVLQIHKTSINIDRSTKLPDRYLAIASKYDADINTYGDLAFIKQSNTMPELFKVLKFENFDDAILDKIK